MHHLLHDLANSVAANSCLMLEVSKQEIIASETRHLSVICNKSKHLSIRCASKLRSFLLPSVRQKLAQVSNKMILHMKSLPSLDLSSSGIKKKLPEDLRKLINLRHLNICGCELLSELPNGIGELSSLKTLPVFIFDDVTARENEDRIAQGLQPNSELKKLAIKNYMGSNLPSWLMNSYLANLVELSLIRCQICVQLPSLEKLDSLRVLAIAEMEATMYFCNDSRQSSGVADFITLKKLNIKAFPNAMQHLTSLHTLHIWSFTNLPSLPEWLGNLVALREIELWYFEHLLLLPESMKRLTALQFLSIWGCPLLEIHLEKDTGADNG
ncbi:Putative disease resistance RPP13-like protein 1 [Morus notabilis]|uniref:Putative disease resistance RPP13-like protein 1 n=1 Tax=Morus notabilis TaxID=981085 RepID=W9QTV5_9ROSA|nr:Putative disease resistance RPP13-like protein 1 [Morus notabilis]